MYTEIDSERLALLEQLKDAVNLARTSDDRAEMIASLWGVWSAVNAINHFDSHNMGSRPPGADD